MAIIRLIDEKGWKSGRPARRWPTGSEAKAR
jgi:hypothetical protein